MWFAVLINSPLNFYCCLLPAAPCKLPTEYPLAFFKEAIIFIAVSFQLSAIGQIIIMLLA
jgi:hypothetical protein